MGNYIYQFLDVRTMILGEAGKQEILQEMFSNRLPNRFFRKLTLGAPVFSLAADDDGLLAAHLPGSLQPNNLNVSNNMDTRHYAYCLTIHVNHASSE